MKSGCYITILSDMTEAVTYRLEDFKKNEVYFGRGAIHGNFGIPNDVSVSDKLDLISRGHCVFLKTEKDWRIRDNGSLNGISCNGVKISTKIIQDGDHFYIGSENSSSKCVLVFSVVKSSKASASESLLQGRAVSVGDKERFVIGRAGDCDLVLSHPTVSRHHCMITKEQERYYIFDNGSLNGVLLNGNTLSGKQLLSEMDKITVAGITMIFSNQSLSILENRRGVGVSVQNLVKKVSARGGDKIIANNITLNIEPGEFAAIIGGSGAGKTTLLNCISGMTGFTSGDVIINGDSILTGLKSLRSIIGYVPQNDIVHDNLTLERMLLYSAKLRMPGDTTREEIQQKIDEVLDMVELTAHRNTFINRLSGGQRKRASIAVELLASPKLFFLDEPSSGLDPGTEKHLMQMLKRLASMEKTVIMVTHTVQNVGMCDRLICMGNGGVLCFSGTPKEAEKFFGKTQLTDIYDDLNEKSIEVSTRFLEYQDQQYQQDSKVGKKTQEPKKRNGLLRSCRQFSVMTARYAEILFNSPLKLMFMLLMPVLLTVIVCLVFQADGNLFNYLNMRVDRTSLPFMVAGDTMKLLFSFSCASFWIGIFNSVQEISKERDIYRREQFSGVRSFPYVMSKFTVMTVLCAVQSIVMMMIFLILTRTTATVDGDIHSVTALTLRMNSTGIVFGRGLLWLELFITLFLSVLSAMALGLAVSSAVSNEMSMVVCPICLLPQILFSGVICELGGLTDKISKFITCRWACIAFFSSVDINSMYSSCKYANDGTWEKVEYAAGVSMEYAKEMRYMFGLNPVLSSWTALLLLTLACIAVSVLFMTLKNTNIKKLR